MYFKERLLASHHVHMHCFHAGKIFTMLEELKTNNGQRKMLTPIKIMEKLKAPDYEDEPFDDSTFPPKSEDALQRENNTLMQDEAYFKNLVCLLISTRDPVQSLPL